MKVLDLVIVSYTLQLENHTELVQYTLSKVENMAQQTFVSHLLKCDADVMLLRIGIKTFNVM